MKNIMIVVTMMVTANISNAVENTALNQLGNNILNVEMPNVPVPDITYSGPKTFASDTARVILGQCRPYPYSDKDMEHVDGVIFILLTGMEKAQLITQEEASCPDIMLNKRFGSIHSIKDDYYHNNSISLAIASSYVRKKLLTLRYAATDELKPGLFNLFLNHDAKFSDAVALIRRYSFKDPFQYK
jgi:hypothetical protein